MTSPITEDTVAEYEFRGGRWRILYGTNTQPPPPVETGEPPTFIGVGGALFAGVGGSVAWGVHQAYDIGLLIVETAADVFAAPSGWTEAPNSPLVTGSSGVAGSVGLHVYWRRAQSNAESPAVLPDTGDHQIARILTFRGCPNTGSPFDTTGNIGTVLATAGSAVAISGGSTSQPNALVLAIVANATDTVTGQASSWANASLTGFAALSGAQTQGATNLGGGFDVAAGALANQGTYGTTTATLATASKQARTHLVLLGGYTPPSSTVGPPPIFYAVGSEGNFGPGANCNLSWPSHQADDIGLAVIQTDAQTPSNNPPAGWSIAPDSPVVIGTAGAAGAVALHLYWKRAASSSEPTTNFGNTADHTLGRIFVFRGCIKSGSPFDPTGHTSGTVTPASASVSIAGASTAGPNRLVLAIVANGTDTATQQVSAWVNATLTGFVENGFSQKAQGNGGGFSLASGQLATAGAFGASTATLLTASLQSKSHLALMPEDISGGGGPPPGSPIPLIWGPYSGTTGLAGVGPDGANSSTPYRLIVCNPHSMTEASFNAQLDICEAQDITMILVTENSPENFGASVGAFNMTQYIAQLNKLTSWVRLSAALNSGRALALIGDEPYLIAKWNGTWTPTLVNQCAREHKIRWPQCWTIIRCDLARLRNGWSGNPAPAAYDALDWGVLQYEGPQSQAGQTMTAALVAEKSHSLAINVGVIAAMNIVAGGVLNGPVYGVAACWDYLNNGTSSGVVVGSVPATGQSLGKQYLCADWQALATSLHKTAICSPAFLRAFADDIFSDPDIAPWVPFYTYAGNLASWYVPYMTRPDLVSALTYVQTKLATRPSASALRAKKVYP